MKKILLLFCIFISIINVYSQVPSKRALNHKYKEVRNFLSEKYDKDITIQDGDISLKHKYGIVTYASFESHPNQKFKVETIFDEGYHNILEVRENLVIEYQAFLTKERAQKELGEILKSFKNFEINYTENDISILLEGDMTLENYSELAKALTFLSQDENLDLLKGVTETSDTAVLLPKFYLTIMSKDVKKSIFPLMDFEIEGIEQSKAIVLEKKGGEIDTLTQYGIFTESSSFKEGNVIKLLQRKLNAVSQLDNNYKLSVGGYYYLKEENIKDLLTNHNTD